MKQVFNENPGKQGIIVRSELIFYFHTNKPEKIYRLDLFQLNEISHDEKVINSAILLDNDATSSHTIVGLPKNDDVSKNLKSDEH